MNNLIKDKQQFKKQAINFLRTIYGPALKLDNTNQIRVGSFKPSIDNRLVSTIEEALNMTYEICNQGRDVYYSINSYAGGCRKENVSYVNTFHAEIDFGSIGHKKLSIHETAEDAAKAIYNFELQPTSIVHSGGGYHAYWVLNEPIKVTKDNIKQIESINKTLSKKLGGDPGTHDISRVLRIPGTYNFKIEDNPREVKLIELNETKYDFNDFEQFIIEDEISSTTRSPLTADNNFNCPASIKYLPIRSEIKKLIVNGNQGEYLSRSEADMAVILELYRRGIGYAAIKDIYENTDFRIGEKYREPGNLDQYLKITFGKAKVRHDELLNLTEEEKDNPLFVQGVLYKENNAIKLDVVKLQKFITYKYKLCRFSEVFFMYKNKCYVECNGDEINAKCQNELNDYVYLFLPNTLNYFYHFAVGQTTIDHKKGKSEQERYLTLQNGLFDLQEEKLIDHTPDIFTTNLMDYKYDATAECPRFIQFLDEVFQGNSETINFVQQAVGYVFHKGMPTPSVFFLIGEGSNGKSVFIDVISCLFGEHNTCKLSLNKFTDERYIPQLFGKMLNISGETPQKRQMYTDVVKEVTGGDMVTGRKLYSDPFNFQPYAKHFLAMNKEPEIDDTSHGMWRRIYPIEFLKVFSKEEQDVFLIDKLKEELPGIFNWALEGYKQLKENKFILTENQRMLNKKQQIKELGNSVLRFASEKLVKSVGTDTRFKEVYDSYLNYCTSEGEKYPKKKSELKSILKGADWKIDNSSKEGNSVCMFDTKLV